MSPFSIFLLSFQTNIFPLPVLSLLDQIAYRNVIIFINGACSTFNGISHGGNNTHPITDLMFLASVDTSEYTMVFN